MRNNLPICKMDLRVRPLKPDGLGGPSYGSCFAQVLSEFHGSAPQKPAVFRHRHKSPTLLQKLARHETIATTMTYYVNLDCEEVTEQLYRVGSVFGSVSAFGPEPAESKRHNPLRSKGL